MEILKSTKELTAALKANANSNTPLADLVAGKLDLNSIQNTAHSLTIRDWLRRDLPDTGFLTKRLKRKK